VVDIGARAEHVDAIHHTLPESAFETVQATQQSGLPGPGRPMMNTSSRSATTDRRSQDVKVAECLWMRAPLLSSSHQLQFERMRRWVVAGHSRERRNPGVITRSSASSWRNATEPFLRQSWRGFHPSSSGRAHPGSERAAPRCPAHGAAQLARVSFNSRSATNCGFCWRHRRTTVLPASVA